MMRALQLILGMIAVTGGGLFIWLRQTTAPGGAFSLADGESLWMILASIVCGLFGLLLLLMGISPRARVSKINSLYPPASENQSYDEDEIEYVRWPSDQPEIEAAAANAAEPAPQIATEPESDVWPETPAPAPAPAPAPEPALFQEPAFQKTAPAGFAPEPRPRFTSTSFAEPDFSSSADPSPSEADIPAPAAASAFDGAAANDVSPDQHFNDAAARDIHSVPAEVAAPVFDDAPVVEDVSAAPSFEIVDKELAPSESDVEPGDVTADAPPVESEQFIADLPDPEPDSFYEADAASEADADTVTQAPPEPSLETSPDIMDDAAIPGESGPEEVRIEEADTAEDDGDDLDEDEIQRLALEAAFASLDEETQAEIQSDPDFYADSTFPQNAGPQNAGAQDVGPDIADSLEPDAAEPDAALEDTATDDGDPIEDTEPPPAQPPEQPQTTRPHFGFSASGFANIAGLAATSNATPPNTLTADTATPPDAPPDAMAAEAPDVEALDTPAPEEATPEAPTLEEATLEEPAIETLTPEPLSADSPEDDASVLADTDLADVEELPDATIPAPESAVEDIPEFETPPEAAPAPSQADTEILDAPDVPVPDASALEEPTAETLTPEPLSAETPESVPPSNAELENMPDTAVTTSEAQTGNASEVEAAPPQEATEWTAPIIQPGAHKVTSEWDSAPEITQPDTILEETGTPSDDMPDDMPTLSAGISEPDTPEVETAPDAPVEIQPDDDTADALNALPPLSEPPEADAEEATPFELSFEPAPVEEEADVSPALPTEPDDTAPDVLETAVERVSDQLNDIAQSPHTPLDTETDAAAIAASEHETAPADVADTPAPQAAAAMSVADLARRAMEAPPTASEMEYTADTAYVEPEPAPLSASDAEHDVKPGNTPESDTAPDLSGDDLHGAARLQPVRDALAENRLSDADLLMAEIRKELVQEGDSNPVELAELTALAGDHALATGRLGGAKWLWRLALKRFDEAKATESPISRAIADRLNENEPA